MAFRTWVKGTVSRHFLIPQMGRGMGKGRGARGRVLTFRHCWRTYVVWH